MLGISFVRQFREPEGVLRPPEADKVLVIDQQYDGDAAVESVAVGGPYNIAGPGDTPSRRKIFSCEAVSGGEEEACASRILSALALRAYRRPVG
jgi:hypothetical protein